MNEPKKQPDKDNAGPAADRVIPRGTDEHSGDDAQRGEDRSAASRPGKRDDADRSDKR